MQAVLSHARIVAVLIAVLPISACSGPSEDAQSEAAAEKVFMIGVSRCALDEARGEQLVADIEAAAKKYPHLSIVFKNAGEDPRKQVAQVEELIGQPVDLLIVNPADAQLLTARVARALDAGIPVIVLHRPVIGDKYSCFIGSDDEKLGAAAGRWLAKKLGGSGKIVELKGSVDDPATADRHKAFREAINHPGFRVIAEVPVDWEQSKAHEEMKGLLARYDDVDAVFAHNDDMARGAYLAAREVGRQDEIIFVGIGALPRKGLQYVRAGELSVSFQVPTGGREAIDLAAKLLAGESVPKHYKPVCRVFTPDSVDKGGKPLD